MNHTLLENNQNKSNESRFLNLQNQNQIIKLVEQFISVSLLKTNYPPVFTSKNKQIVWELTKQSEKLREKEKDLKVSVSRWMGSIDQLVYRPNGVTIKLVSGMYTYEQVDVNEEPTLCWQVNFADVNLFGFYGSDLLAQDEVQVAEHPCLASVREWMVASNVAEFVPLTRIENVPTPILVQNVDRNIHLKMYGNSFAYAQSWEIKNRVDVLNPKLSNIIAMSALAYGKGSYTLDQLHFSLETAYTAFRAAKIIADSQGKRVCISTGHWGCGAFGGNTICMFLIQAIAANLADVDQLQYFFVEEKSKSDVEFGLKLFKDIDLLGERPVASILHDLLARNFKWGFSNGT